MTKKIKLLTDDPDQSTFYLYVSGPIDKKAKVEPSALYLNGKPGETIEASITITPNEKRLFTNLVIEKKSDSSLITELVSPDQEGGAWKVLLKITSDQVRHIFETLTLKPDNPGEPAIKVRVSANFSKQG